MSEDPGTAGGTPPWTAPGGPSRDPGPPSGIPYPGQPSGVPLAQPPAYPVGYRLAAPPAVPVSLGPGGGPPGLGVGGPQQVRVEPVAGTEFGVAYAAVAPTVSGLAVGSLVAGIGSIAVALLVACFGVSGGQDGWGPIVAGAFAVLAGLLGLAGVGLGFAAIRQIRNGRGRNTGRGLAISGLSCGGTGVLLTAGGMLVAVVALAS